ncbi:uncharacterized protein A4U43_C10F1600 [Asparagus officinalis]|uniref:HTH La-type RNA-binding domain-containing protein n=1 Tax=Asparagus officinalis TaxID=4686 RepID=A0A5P1E0C6_ASPOF|nr:la-related protein 1B-like [Asparagus officinalis]ONK55849.1 uncharacterized protein A4U43_C10F1600 [Asparagus officinalis]
MSPSIMRPPLRPFPGNPMGFHDVPHPIYIMPQPPSVPFVPYQVPNAMFFPALDSLRAQLLHQIEYYFSDQNLSKDEFLRRHMDDQGWVPISVIARFNRVALLTNQLMQLTNNIQQFILETMRLSTVVEVQGEKIRRRNVWGNYLLTDGVATRLTNLNIRG